MIEFLRLLNRPCRDMSRLISVAQDRSLSRSERLAVKMHLLYCTACRRFKHQTQYLRQTFLGLPGGALPDDSAPGLSPEARQRIKRFLRQP